jgi:hypothetical protein
VSGGDAPPLDVRDLPSLKDALEVVNATMAMLETPQQREQWAVALLLCHAQDNWMGPPLGKALVATGIHVTNARCLLYISHANNLAEQTNNEALVALSVSGERAQATLRSPLLLGTFGEEVNVLVNLTRTISHGAMCSRWS